MPKVSVCGGGESQGGLQQVLDQEQHWTFEDSDFSKSRLLLILGFPIALTKEWIAIFLKTHVDQIKCEVDKSIKKLVKGHK